MSDYSELKRRAEALLEHANDSFYLPCSIAYDRAANPASVLALIADLEKTKADRKACWKEFKAQGRQLDQLKADNETLREILEVTRDYRDAAQYQLNEARKDNESLRKDAARYQWIRDVMCLDHLRETVESAQSAEDYDFCIDQDISRDNDSPENPS